MRTRTALKDSVIKSDKNSAFQPEIFRAWKFLLNGSNMYAIRKPIKLRFTEQVLFGLFALFSSFENSFCSLFGLFDVRTVRTVRCLRIFKILLFGVQWTLSETLNLWSFGQIWFSSHAARLMHVYRDFPAKPEKH